MMTWTYDWVFSWHLTKGALTEMNRRTHLTAKYTYMVQMKPFEVRGLK
jgi:hypothetical protein